MSDDENPNERSPAQMRAQFTEAIEAGEHALARRIADRFWRANPTTANAPAVLAMLGKLPEAARGTPLSVFFLRSFTVEPAFNPLKASAAFLGLDVTARAGEFNAYVQEIIDPTSALYTSEPDVIVLAVQARDLLPEIWTNFTDHTTDEVDEIIERALSSLSGWIEMIRSRTQAHLVIHGMECPAFPANDPMDGQDLRGQQAALRRFNRELVLISREHAGVHVLDYDGLVSNFGRDRWHDEKKWLTMRMPVAADALTALADGWLRFLAPLSGRAAKCLVCDLDNTMWGGIIGEDGMDGIALGIEYPGAAFQQFQRAALDLYNQGVILAICSKNNHDDGMEGICKHPGMLLGEEHFAAVRINWQDKVTNLREIAAELNIGIDSLVFIDDNPVEREMVREMLPEVTVLDIDEHEPLGHARAVRACPLFARLALSDDDRRRGQMYAEQRQRSELQSNVTSMEDYYRSLEMVADIGQVDEARLARVAQLTQKTNQLNMTTRRYSEQEISAFADDPDARVYWINVKDRFGDNGVVGVMITRAEGDTWSFDTFLMSCRVIGRTVETAMLATVTEDALAAGAKRLAGWFLPTKKNAPAQAIYENHGFKKTEESGDGTRWELDLGTDPVEAPEWIQRNRT